MIYADVAVAVWLAAAWCARWAGWARPNTATGLTAAAGLAEDLRQALAGHLWWTVIIALATLVLTSQWLADRDPGPAPRSGSGRQEQPPAPGQ